MSLEESPMDAAKKEALAANPAVLMDGRTRRLLDSLKGQLASMESELNALTFKEDLDTGGDKKRKSALQEAFKTKSRKLSKIESDASAALKRIKDSSSKAALGEVSSAISCLAAKVSKGSKFAELMKQANPPPEVLHLSLAFGLVVY